MALYLALRPNLRGTWVRVFHWGFILAASVGVMLTGSRAGALALVVATVWTLFVLGVIQRGRFFSTKIPVVMAVLAGALFIALLVPTGLLERIAEIKSVPDTFVLRWTAWWKGAEAWMGSPILGVGGGAFAEAIVRLGAEKRMVSHNILVTVTVEKGIVGILLFLWFAWTLLRDMRFLPRSERLLWQGVSLAWFLCSLSAGSGADKLSWFVFGMVLVQTRLFRHAASMSRGKAVTLPAINRTSPNLRGAQ
jgi:hypothetical protein